MRLTKRLAHNEHQRMHDSTEETNYHRDSHNLKSQGSRELFLTPNVFFAVVKNEALPSHLPASSRMCHVGLLQLHAVTAKEWHSPRGSRVQQVLSSLDVHMHGHGLSTHSVFYRTAGREGERRAVR